MTFLRYPEYKDSGVAWLGEVPGHWEVKPFYSVAAECEEPNIGMQEDNLLSLSYGRIVQKDISSNDGLLPESFETYQIIRPGDIVFRLTDLQNDKRSLRTALVEETGIITSAYVAARPIKVESRYLSYLLRAYDVTKVFYSMGGGLRQSMKFAELKRLPTLIPSLEEQQAIAAFLDRETGKIDALISEQQRLVALLVEKRLAMISHAVTKGLNPTARMKDSGIEWLGEVPEHWDVMPLKRDLRFLTSGSRGWADHYADDGALFIRIGNLPREDIHLDLSDIQRVDVPDGTEGERTKVQAGDVLFSITAYLGSVAVVPEDLETAYVSQHVALARLSSQSLLPSWVAYLTLSSVGKTYLETQGYGGTKVQLSLDDVRNIPMLVPALDEQRTIVSFLETETTKFDTLTAEANRAIALLQERRSALVSAAVTGKIDVRNTEGQASI